MLGMVVLIAQNVWLLLIKDQKTKKKNEILYTWKLKNFFYYLLGLCPIGDDPQTVSDNAVVSHVQEIFFTLGSETSILEKYK